MNARLATMLAMVLVLASSSPTQLIFLYDHVGRSSLLGVVMVPATGCVHLESWQNDKVSAVKVPGNKCVILHEDINCQGRNVRVGPVGVNGCPNHSNLNSCDFNDRASSVSRC